MTEVRRSVITITSGVAVLTIICQLVVPVAAQNYCSAQLCSGSKHIACGNSGRFAASCPANARRVVFNQEQKNLVLRSHNRKRNWLAGGNLKRFRQAKRMATMRWDNELAKLAGLNVLGCTMEHDACHNTNSFKASGQNLAIISFTGPEPRASINSYINESMQLWWGEFKDTTQSYLSRYPSNYKGPQIGHFTVMSRDSNTHVGCGAATFRNSDGWNNVLVACNYATTNWVNRPIYVAGPAASGCRSRNPNFRNLCSINEVYNDLK